MSSFPNLSNALSTDTHKKGEQFERITKWILEDDSGRVASYTTRHEHSQTTIPKTLLWREYPAALRTDNDRQPSPPSQPAAQMCKFDDPVIGQVSHGRNSVNVLRHIKHEMS